MASSVKVPRSPAGKPSGSIDTSVKPVFSTA
jgi:hypothetical protein